MIEFIRAYMPYHMAAFAAGFLLDLLLGDPYWMPHPIRLIGNLIGSLEKKWNTAEPRKALRNGRFLVIAVVGLTLLSAAAVMAIGYLLPVVITRFWGVSLLDVSMADAGVSGSGVLDMRILDAGISDAGYMYAETVSPFKHLILSIAQYLGVVIEAVLTYYILATKCLKVESMKVYHALKENNVEKARFAVSMIVGRDTSVLDDIGIAKAAIETVAENTSDGIIAPMLYTALGGPILGFAYKSINTMDSMVGYKNDRYLNFGRCAAHLDDVVNFLPSRISAYLMMIGCGILSCLPRNRKKDPQGNKLQENNIFSMKGAYRIHKRDSRKHASPNSAQTESTCAGALGIQLAGPAVYFGEVHNKPFIGDADRPVEYEDIPRANQLLYATTFLCELICLGLMACWL